MEMALNIGAFDDISLQDLMEINGGVNWWNLDRNTKPERLKMSHSIKSWQFQIF